MRKSKIYFLCVLLVAFFFGGVFQESIAGEDLTYKAQASYLLKRADDILIRNGLCTGKNRDCVHKEFILSAGTSSGILVEIYELDIKVVSELIQLCISIYEENHRDMAVVVEVYKEPHKQRVGKLFRILAPAPYLEMSIKGEK